ncbi:MAG: ATP-binding protein [Kofleriaceae bacterium]
MTSLRRRMLVAIGVAVSLAFLVSGTIVVVVMRASLSNRIDESLVREAEALSSLVEQDADGIESEIPRSAVADSSRLLQLWREPGGERIERSESLTTDLVRARGAKVLEPITLPDGRDGRQITLRFTPRYDERVDEPARATLVLARPTDDVDATIWRIALVLIFAGIAGTLACLVASRWLVSYSLSPLRTLATRIAEIRETDLALRLADARTPIEVQPLVARLDELLERLERAFARERELTAEVAHELRTPIAGLRSTIELALDRDRSAERYRAALSGCLAITLQAQRMVDVLLSLARLDAAPRRDGASAPIAVDALVRELIAEHVTRAGERALTLDAQLEPATAAVDRDELRVIVANALDNAVSYASEGTTIRIATRSHADRVRIEIANATTLEAADASRVFDRFWRADPARAAGAHAGLGLALCKKLVDRMGGTITAIVAGDEFTLTIELQRT